MVYAIMCHVVLRNLHTKLNYLHYHSFSTQYLVSIKVFKLDTVYSITPNYEFQGNTFQIF